MRRNILVIQPYISMKLVLKDIPIKPISVNKAYYKANNKLTREARKVRLELFTFLANTEGVIEELKAFRAAFKPTEHQLEVKYTFKVPKKIFYKATDGSISMRSGDVDNYIKVLNDFLFNEKYFEDTSRYEFTVYNVGIDDRFITRLEAEKAPSRDLEWKVSVEVGIKDLVQLEAC